MRKAPIRKITLLAVLGVALGTGAGAYAAFSSATGTTTQNFSAASSFNNCPGNTTPVWMTGFEHGVTPVTGSGLSAYGTGAAVDSTVKRTGSYSVKLTPAAGVTAYAGPTVGGTTGVMRLAIRFPTLPSANVAQLAMLYPNDAVILQLGYRASDQKLTLSWNGASPVASATAITAGTWYVIDMRARVGVSPRIGDWAINGVSQTSVTSAQAASTLAVALLGSLNGTDVYSANYDDVAVSQTSGDYPIGDGHINALAVDGVGTHNNPGNFTEDGGGAIGATTWNRLDEVPMTSTADYVQQTANSSTSYLSFTFADPADTCIRAVSAVLAYHAGGSPADNGKTSLLDGSTERVVYSGDMSETALSYKQAVIAPASAPWTQTAVKGLTARVGFSTDTNPNPFWDGLLLEYETP